MSAAPTAARDLDFTPRTTVFASPRDWRDQIIYHLLLDRFDDCEAERPMYDPANAQRGRDPEVRNKFQGGKIKGVTRRLDYIQGLGVTTIWISPPFKNRQEDDQTPMGYGFQNLLAVDPRFGTLEDLQELVQQAHRRGMYVILDIVINHSGDNWAYENDEPRPYIADGRHNLGFWRKRDGGRVPIGQEKDLGPDDGVWPVELQKPDCYHRQGYIKNMASYTPDEGLNGDFFALKDFDLKCSDTLDTLIRCFKWWIAACDIDGYRIDTVTHTEPESTGIFLNAIREYCKSIEKDNFLLYAEIVSGDERLQKYIGRNTSTPEEEERYPTFGAVLDFPLYFILEEVIKGYKPPTELRERYESFRHFYRDFSEAGEYFVTFVDNHDQMSRPYKRFGNAVTDPHLSILAVGYLLTNMGIPCIYYGTEQGFDGGGGDEAYVRESMFGGTWGAFDTRDVQFFNRENPIYRGIAKLAQVRAKERALRYGREYFREMSGDGEHFGHPRMGACTLAYSRVLDVDEILIALNLDANDRADYIQVDAKLTPAGSTMRDLLGDDDAPLLNVEQTKEGYVYVRVPLKGHRMAILKKA